MLCQESGAPPPALCPEVSLEEPCAFPPPLCLALQFATAGKGMSTVVGGWVLQGNTIGTWGLSVWAIPTFLVLLMLVPPGGPVRAVLQMKVVASPPYPARLHRRDERFKSSAPACHP